MLVLALMLAQAQPLPQLQPKQGSQDGARPQVNVRCVADSFGNYTCTDGSRVIRDSFGNVTVIPGRK